MFLSLTNSSDFVRALVNGAILYSIWITAHYVAAHVYPIMCAPLTLTGFIMSMFMVATPQCVALRWVIYTGAAAINNMWIMIGCWVITYIATKSK